jgi:hypothetical protein
MNDILIVAAAFGHAAAGNRRHSPQALIPTTQQGEF